MVATRSISPDAIRSTAHAPRMRRSSMSQETRVYERPVLSWFLEHEQMVTASLITILVLAGTGIARAYDTAYDTSNPFIPPPHTGFLRTKDNFLNQVFVKRAWGWTLSCVLSQLLVLPSVEGRPSTRQRVAALALATAMWYAFTGWFFGAGLGDRIISLTGGVCAVPAPAGLDQQSHQGLLASLGSPHPLQWPNQFPAGFVPVAPTFCNLRTALTSQSHPLLFSRADPSKLRSLTPRWTKGLDISGHIWLLTLASMRLSAEVGHGLRAVFFSRSDSSGAALIKLSTLYSATVMTLWAFMLLITSVYFHRESEKLVALALGLFAAWLVRHGAAYMAPYAPETPAMDENAARRRMARE